MPSRGFTKAIIVFWGTAEGGDNGNTVHRAAYNVAIRVSSFACFFSFAKHETKRNSSSVSRNFACFAKQNISRNFVSFRFVNSKISFRFAKFHLDSLRFATFHLVSYRFAKFHLVWFCFADIQTVSFHKVNML
jgi:hypothetical protein